MLTCSIKGCARKHKARGWCDEHYLAWRKYGDPLARKRRKRGSGTLNDAGYHVVCKDGTDKRTHIAIAEKALGKPLPPGAEIHHVDENRANNEPTNLVICSSHAYHALLHLRSRALAECGHADWRKCKRCAEWGDINTMTKDGKSMVHRTCNVIHVRAARQRRATPAERKSL